MPFKRFVQTGRVALLADGPNKGKLVSIVDVIDQTRVLIDGPETGVSRQPVRLNQLHLTKFRIKFPFTGNTKTVRDAWNKAKLEEQWKKSMWARKIEAKEKRASLSDFDRFKLRKARSIRNKIRSEAYYRLKKKSSTDGTLYGKKKMPKPKGKKEGAAKKGRDTQEKKQKKVAPAKK